MATQRGNDKITRTGIWGVAVPSVLGAAEGFFRVDPFGGLTLQNIGQVRSRRKGEDTADIVKEQE